MLNPYYEDDLITVFHGDIRGVTELGAPGSALCVVHSPPYNAGIGYDEHDDAMAWAAYGELAAHVSRLTFDVLAESGRSWVNVTPVMPIEPLAAGDHSGRSYAKRLGLLSIWANAIEAAELNIQDVVAWATPGRGPGCAWGSWQSPAGPNMRGEWEAIIAASRGAWGRTTPPEHKGWKDGGDWMPLTTNLWKMTPESNRTHPAPFPLELPLEVHPSLDLPGRARHRSVCRQRDDTPRCEATRTARDRIRAQRGVLRDGRQATGPRSAVRPRWRCGMRSPEAIAEGSGAAGCAPRIEGSPAVPAPVNHFNYGRSH